VIVPIRLAVDDAPVGYLTAARQLSITQGYVRSYADVAEIGMTLTDQSGAVVASTGDRSLGQVDPGNADWVTPALRGDSGVVTIDTPDGPQLLSYRALPSGWTVAAQLPESTVLAPWYELRTAVLVLSLVLATGFAVTGLVIFYVTRGRQRAVIALGAAHDQLATANAHLEARVEQRTRELTAAVDDLEGFAYSVSHDLRTPLRAIAGFSQALADDGHALDDTDRHYLQRIRAAAGTMGRLIDDLLRLSRVGRSQLSIGAVDITPIAREIVQDSAHHTGQDDNQPAVHIPDRMVVQATGN
jgi:signal transduction histidine kinase